MKPCNKNVAEIPFLKTALPKYFINKTSTHQLPFHKDLSRKQYKFFSLKGCCTNQLPSTYFWK